MALLNDSVKKQIQQVFTGLQGPVKLVMFTQGEDAGTIECQMCADTRTLIEEISSLDDKISLEIYDFVKDEPQVKQYNIDKIPAIAVLGDGGSKDYGIRLYGIPSGYEFSTLIEDIVIASGGKHDLKPKTVKELGRLNKPVRIQVFTTPT